MDVFVYGTLTNPARAEAVLGDTDSRTESGDPIDYEFAGDATLQGLHRVDGEYPTLVPGGSVDGRILQVDEHGLEALDAYEGVDQDLYVRAALPSLERSDETMSGASFAEAHEVTLSGGSGGAETREPAAENVVWTYIGDPDRLGVDLERETGTSWPGSGPFRERVRRRVNRNDTVVLIPE